MRAGTRGSAILAAGASRRLGEPKQLVRLHDQPLIRRVADIAAAVGGADLAVVVGAEAERVKAALQGVACDCLDNAAWSDGIASSIQVAVRWAQLRELSALMLLACDQARLTAEHVLQLWAAWERAPLVPAASEYAQTLGVPAIFPSSYYPALLSLSGDRGAAKLLKAGAVTRVPWPDGAVDLDTPEDLARLRE